MADDITLFEIVKAVTSAENKLRQALNIGPNDRLDAQEWWMILDSDDFRSKAAELGFTFEDNGLPAGVAFAPIEDIALAYTTALATLRRGNPQGNLLYYHPVQLGTRAKRLHHVFTAEERLRAEQGKGQGNDSKA